MLSQACIISFQELLSEKIVRTQPLYGGDINEVYVLSTATRRVVVKVNNTIQFPNMFQEEAKGLDLLKQSNSFKIPKVFGYGEVKDGNSFLLLEYIGESNNTKSFSETFGTQLASLHSYTSSYFGFETNNYIGSLPQYNSFCDNASDFYITQRLQPQFELARQKGFTFQEENTLYNSLKDSIPDEKPSLIHGDLWSGNYIVGSDTTIFLIDPAVAFAPREMDLGMMHLFGGFPEQLFEVYNEVFPLQQDWKKRLPLWQLYYLLVHLNLFGASYYPRIKSILKQYTS
ncbi:fructosamine kinase family protein [Aquimarina sp. 2201CG1-2-11]|uniref:fructosamine kinase family protein n=1 Tax=Aquimarina discodermiae TaxID=3231043 RepID=UPI00346316C3